MAGSIPNKAVSKSNVDAAIIDLGVKKSLETLVDAMNGANFLGTPGASTVLPVQAQSVGVVQQIKLSLNALAVAVSDTNVGGGTLMYTMPQGRILMLGAMASLAFTTTSAIASTLNAGVTINYGLGSVKTTTQGSGTLATTEQDILPTTNATSSATINVAGAVAKGVSTAAAYFDGTTTALPIHLNIGVAGATDIDADATVTVSGEVLLTFINLGTQ